MKNHIIQFFLAIIMFVAVCLLTMIVIKPFSAIIFIGSAAGITSAIILLWGTHLLGAIVAGSIILHLILQYYFSVSFNLAIYMISTLAICLQAFWVKRLTYKVVPTQKWLDSRIILFAFIFKIGPLASVISALASVLIAILYVKDFHENLVYVFFRTWSASTLISVFAIPVLLFTQGNYQLKSSKKIFVIISSILGGVSIALLFKIFQDQHQHYRLDDFEESSAFIKSELKKEIEHIEHQLDSFKAYFETSKNITLDEFNDFSAFILSDFSKIDSVEWVPVVTHDNRSIYESYVTDLLGFDYQITEQTISGARATLSEEPLYIPVQYVYPRYQNEYILGDNMLSHSDKKIEINNAISTGTASATIPVNFIEGDFANPVINIIIPIYNKKLEPVFGQYAENGNDPIVGVVVGVVKLSSLFSKITNYMKERNINISIKGFEKDNAFVVYGHDIDISNKFYQQGNTIVFSKQWTYVISERAAWILQDKKWQTWAMLFGGTFGGLIFQMLLLMMAAYSTELTYRVSKQTRELILSKEKSDKENKAKTEFLHSLSTELRTPLSVITKLVEVFPTKQLPVKEKEYLENIGNASLNLEQLIDTLNELSTIESGKLILNKQSFDFVVFLNRMEDIVDAQAKKIKFVVQKDVPQFIKTDELRLQQVFIACIENACQLFAEKELSVSVRVHFHKLNNATIVFAITSTHEFNKETLDNRYVNEFKEDLSQKNLRMAMVKELCNKLDGDISFVQTLSRQSILNFSIKVMVTQNRDYEFGRFNQFSTYSINKNLNTKRILFIEGRKHENTNLCRQFEALNFQVDIKTLEDDFIPQQYQLVVYDCSDWLERNSDLYKKINKNTLKLPSLAIFNKAIEGSQLMEVNEKFTSYIVLPLTTENLNNVIKKLVL